MFVFTLEVSIVKSLVMSPSSASFAFALNIVLFNVSPHFIVTSFAVIVGASFLTSLAFTVTVTLVVATAPLESFTVKVNVYVPAFIAFTSPDISTLSARSPSSLSLAFMLSIDLSNESPSVIVTLSALIVGFSFTTSFSLTVTVTFLVVTAPLESCTVIVIVYTPALVVLTVPLTATLSVKSPSSLSVAFICKSARLNLSPTFNVISLAVITGASFLTSGFTTFCFTVTVTFFSALAPLESFTVNVNLYVPAFEVSTLPDISTLSVKSPSSLSVAFIFNISLENSSPVYKVKSSAVITGASFSEGVSPFSLTVTFTVLVVWFPNESLTVIVIWYIPAFEVSTLDKSTSALSVKSPSSLSVTARSKSFTVTLSPTVNINSSLDFITGAESSLSGVSGVSPITNHLL